MIGRPDHVPERGSLSTAGSPRPLASLSSGLLARKGMARPAMRPQGVAAAAAPQAAQDDLGWNDMGDATPAAPPLAAVPPVLVQREALAELVSPAEPEPDAACAPAAAPVAISLATVARIDRETRGGPAKAAFTLRLDPDRRLRLRLACAVRNQSAQCLVSEALDVFLETLPKVDELARQLPPRATR